MPLYSIGELATLLGVAVITLRRWHQLGKLVPCCRTPGGHRRYDLASVRRTFGLDAHVNREKLTLCYARVSSHDQKEHLATQAKRLEQHCSAQGWSNTVTLQDLGSGLNYKKPGLLKLLRLILSGEVQRLVLITKDRLLRFGSELLFQVCHSVGVEVVILDAQPEIPRAQQLTEDLVEILTVFSSRLYGSRSRKNLRAIAPMAA